MYLESFLMKSHLFCPGIIEFKSNSVYAETIIAIGVRGMEWAMNDGRTNVYAFNIQRIYRN
jgi:hypothetical protein